MMLSDVKMFHCIRLLIASCRFLNSGLQDNQFIFHDRRTFINEARPYLNETPCFYLFGCISTGENTTAGYNRNVHLFLRQVSPQLRGSSTCTGNHSIHLHRYLPFTIAFELLSSLVLSIVVLVATMPSSFISSERSITSSISSLA